MLIGLYSAAAGMIVQREKQDVTARNLANVNVTGYKKEELTTVSFDKILKDETNEGVENNKLSVSYLSNTPLTIFKQGELKYTGRPLDLALEGEGFFHLKTPYGEMYTRDGRLKLNKEGELVTATQGYLVLDQAGQTISIAGSDKGDPSAYMQKIFIDEEGMVSLMQADISGSTQIGQLRLVEFENPQNLENLGYGLYKEPEVGTKKQVTFETKIRQEYLEQANINIIEEMREMIRNIRTFEVNQKVIKEIDKTLGASITAVGMA